MSMSIREIQIMCCLQPIAVACSRAKTQGVTLRSSNEGISGRRVEALLVDRNNPARLYAGVVNDKSYGGVFVSNNGGTSWDQIGEGPGGGLAGRDVFALAEAGDGTVVAGTNHGIFVLNLSNRSGDKNTQPTPTPPPE